MRFPFQFAARITPHPGPTRVAPNRAIVMASFFRILTFLLVLSSCLLATPGPKIDHLGGIVKTAQSRRALICGLKSSFFRTAPSLLGDYTLERIDSSSVRFRYEIEFWDFPLQQLNASRQLPMPALPGSTPADLSFRDVDYSMVLKCLAEMMNESVWISPKAEMVKVDLEARQCSLPAAIKWLAARKQLEVSDATGIVTIAPANELLRLPSIAGAAQLPGSARFDFVDTNLIYALNQMAQGQHLSLLAEGNVGGAVTLSTARPLPLRTLFPIFCLSAEDGQAAAQGSLLLLGPRIPAAVSLPSSPKMRWIPEKVYEPVGAATLLQKAARVAGKQLVLPPGFQGKVFARIDQLEALRVAERTAVICGYRFELIGKQIRITR